VVTAREVKKARGGESFSGRLAIFLELAGEGLGSGKQPRGEERAAHGMLSRGLEADVVAPRRPQAPAQGSKTPRWALMNIPCSMGVSLTMPQPSSG